MKKILTTIEITFSSIVFILYCVYLFASGVPPFGVLSVALNPSDEPGTRMFALYCSGNYLLWRKGVEIIDDYIDNNIIFLRDNSVFSEVRNWRGRISANDKQFDKIHNLIRGELIFRWGEYNWYWLGDNDFSETTFYYKYYGDTLNVETAYTAISLMRDHDYYNSPYWVDHAGEVIGQLFNLHKEPETNWVDHAREVVGQYNNGELQNLSKEDKQYIQEIKYWLKEYDKIQNRM
ncbi:MAG: hypothetical protein IJ213_00890 [Bacteroidales bacterium]|nr:hypothetical protein [Bacteroidales bacterium]